MTLELDDGCPSLRELIVPNNALASLKGVAKCPRLRLLDADNNAIKSLAGITAAVKEWAGDAAVAATALPTTPAAMAAAVAAPREPSDDDSEAESKPLYRLQVLSLRGNALPEDSWASVDALAALGSLRELRLGGNPLVGTPFQPRRLDLSSIAGAPGGDGECRAARACACIVSRRTPPLACGCCTTLRSHKPPQFNVMVLGASWYTRSQAARARLRTNVRRARHSPASRSNQR